jgi:hypothetical protein
MVWWCLPGDSPGERSDAPHGLEFSGAAFGWLFTLQALCKLHEKTSRERGNFWPLTAITLSGVNGFEIAIAPGRAAASICSFANLRRRAAWQRGQNEDSSGVSRSCSFGVVGTCRTIAANGTAFPAAFAVQ